MTKPHTILINSVPRSGSTLMTTIMQAHPYIKALYQPLFSYQFKNRISLQSTKNDLKQYLDDLQTTQDVFCTMQSNYHTDNQQTPYLQQLGIAPNPDTSSATISPRLFILVIKHVRFHCLLSHLLELDPNIGAILLIRDPRAVIYSQMTSKKEGLLDWLDGSDRNSDDDPNVWGLNGWIATTSLFKSLAAKYPDRVLLLKYEDLILQPKQCLDTIYQHFSLHPSNQPKKIALQLAATPNETGYDYSVYRRSSTYPDPNAPNDLHEAWQDKLDPSIAGYIKYRVQY